jgi:hypothetical protein
MGNLCGITSNNFGAQKDLKKKVFKVNSQTSNIKSNNSQNGGLEDYNNISDGIFPHFTTLSIKLGLG